MPCNNANSVDPDKTPRSAVSDLGLHCCQCPFHGTPGLNGLTDFSLKTPKRIIGKQCRPRLDDTFPVV